MTFRWNQTTQGEPGLFTPEQLLVPELGTGRMSGLEFLHVTARTMLNHVPDGSRAPTNWTINVYRGCSHGCSYCLAGDTTVLMADGRTKPISDVRARDLVYGTVRRGSHRRYTPTEVVDHWQTTKRAYRVTLADGTEIVASGDHRFLTDRGWKHVAGAPPGRQRPHLTTNNSLLGLGLMAETPPECDEYRRGYLTGMIRGDASLATCHYTRPGRAHADVHRFRLALADLEPLDRSRRYLGTFDVPTTTFEFSAATANHREMTAIRTSAGPLVARIRGLIEWPDQPSDQWHRGFLGGIFDAEGSHRRGILRISNGDPEILDRTLASARHLGFTAVLEGANANGVRNIRIAGGLRERLRFMATCNVVTTRKRTIDDVAIETDAPLRVASVEDLGIEIPMYDITTGTGDFIANGVVSHNCFARPTHEYLGLNRGTDFDTRIVVKINAVEKVRAELADPRWTGAPVAMGTNTDPYQRAEAKYRLTRGVIEALAERRNPFSILTKSPLVTRDLDLLTEAARTTDVAVNFSIATLDQHIWRTSEPGAPNPRRRIEAMARLSAAGIRTGALVAPILPGLSDRPEQLREVVTAIDNAGGRLLGLGALHLRPGVREHFLDWLHGAFPAQHADYVRRYADSDYAPQRYFEQLYAKAGIERPARLTPRGRR